MNSVTIVDKFKPLYLSKDRYFVVSGGRGGSKSFTIADFILRLTFEVGHVILFTRYTMTSASISIIPEFNEKIELLGCSNYFDTSNGIVRNLLTDSKIIFRGIKTSSGNQTANLKSIQGVTTWVLDEAEEMPDEKTFDKIDDSIRQIGIQNRVILVLNPSYKKHWIYEKFFKHGSIPNTTYIHTTYLDNIKNLNQSFIDKANITKSSNYAKYAHVYLGEWIDESNNAIFKHGWIESNRVQDHPSLKRVVVAIDPSVTSTEQSDECGIVVVGIGIDNQYYVLEDCSGIYTPNGWALKAIYLYEKYKADRIVAEVNNGGDLVETVIKNFDRSVAYKSVHASRGKVTRAEPIAALYEQNQVHHVGVLKDLEYQMTTWDETQGISPGRIDALVWAITELSTPKVNTNSWA